MQYPGPLLVGVGIQQCVQVVDRGIYDGCLTPGGVLDHGKTFFPHALCQYFLTIFRFHVQICTIGRETFTQPNVVPIGFGGGIAKPLVRNFVGNQGFPFFFAVDRVFKIEDVTGIFHAPVAGFGLHVGQFAVGIGSDVGVKPFQHFHSLAVVDESFCAVVGKYPGADGNALYFARQLYRKRSNPDHRHFHGQGSGFFPVGAT